MPFEVFTCRFCDHWNQAHMSEPRCKKCHQRHRSRDAQVHQSERAVVYYNPRTGEHKTPPRADLPMPGIYAAQGFERREIQHMSSWEKEAGVIHEASNYGRGNETRGTSPEPTPSCPPEVTKALVEDVAAAIASGPMTESDNSPDRFSLGVPLAPRV